MSMTDFRNSIKVKDVEGNRTYIYTTFEGCKYGQSYQNTTRSREDMISHFVSAYYPLVEERREDMETCWQCDKVLTEDDDIVNPYDDHTYCLKCNREVCAEYEK